MDLQQLLKVAGEMKERISGLSADAENVRAEGESGAGLVRVVMNGKHEVVSIQIDPRTLVPSEVALLEDLIRAATNQAAQKVAEAMKERMSRMAKQLGVDPSMLGGTGLF